MKLCPSNTPQQLLECWSGLCPQIVTKQHRFLKILRAINLHFGGQLIEVATAANASAHLKERLAEQDITCMQATPATWRMLLEADWPHRPGFKALIGGEALPRDLIAPLLQKVDQLWNMYGPTETTVWSTCVQVTDPAAPITIGTPIANTQIYILGPDDQPCPVNVPGELCIGGDGVARGYANREDSTAEKFVEITVSVAMKSLQNNATRLYISSVLTSVFE